MPTAIPSIAQPCAAASVREFVDAAVAAAPPLTEQQVARLGAILSPLPGNADGR
ncbi:hypothetical protein [Brachybacterium sp. NPDC056505]|uniref:hypothetical protein n=1 Tax=Brachybacterium sp. NPDC056505 TaxID=3345843 RepID=UPI0036711C26